MTKPKVEEVKAVVVDEKEMLLAEITKILLEHNMMESNIGVSSPYWGLLKRYRSL